MRTISVGTARRLAVTAQRLSGPAPGPKAMLEVIRQLGCLQLDPVSAVTPSHRLVLFSRLGNYSQADLDRLLWQERSLFEYWAHAASIVLTEDYPIHRETMRRYARGETARSRRAVDWAGEKAALRREILGRIRRRGAQPVRAFEDTSNPAWVSGGWSSGGDVDRMVEFLWVTGELMVARRQGGYRWWDLARRCLPGWTPRQRISTTGIVRTAAQRSLRALGVARAADIQNHFIRGRYPGLPQIMARLEGEGVIVRLEIDDEGRNVPGRWYVHASDLPLLDRIESGDWQPRTTLLSPFDNLICDRARTRLLFGFDFSLEIYLPAARRRFGYYVLSVLEGDRLVGRLDVAMNRAQQQLELKGVHLEPTKEAAGAGPSTTEAVRDLAEFLGARKVALPRSLPRHWRLAMRAAF